MGINLSTFNQQFGNNDKNDSIDHEFERKRKEKKIFRISATIFYVLIVFLLLMTIIEAYKKKTIVHNFDQNKISDDEKIVCEDTWTDILMSTITWTALIIAGYLIAKSIKYNNEANYTNNFNEMDENQDKNFEIIKNNENLVNNDMSQKEKPINDCSKPITNNLQLITDDSKPNIIDGRTPWLTVVRNDAYETHRRLSGGTNDIKVNLN